MTHPYLAAGLAQEHERDVRANAARARLVAIARCCRPSRIREALGRVRARIQGPPVGSVCCG